MLNLNDPDFETERIRALHSYNILDSLSEEEYDNITFLASMICDVPIAVISFVDVNRQWFKSAKGLTTDVNPREYSFCAHAINSPQEFFIVPDSREDHRFRSNPLVTGHPNIVFYAGVPLLSQDGFGLGTVCVIDNKPRELNESQLKALKILSRQVMFMLETKKSNEDLKRIKKEIDRKNTILTQYNEKLERSEDQLRKISEHADVMITVLDTDIEATFVTKTWSTFTGKSVDELVLFGWKDLIHKDDVQQVYDTVHKAVETQAPYSLTYRILNAEGIYIWLHTDGSPDISADGTFIGYIASTLNLTNLKRAEADLGRISKQLELALEAGKFGTYEMDLKSGRYKSSQRHFEHLGIATDHLPLTLSSLLSVVHAADRPAIHNALAKCIREKVPYEAEYRVTRADGSFAWIRESGIPAFSEEGDPISISGISADISEQKNFTTELEARVAERTSELNARFINLGNTANM